MAQTVGIRITENTESNERQEQVLDAPCNTMQEIRTELGKNREEETSQTPKELTISIRPKTAGIEWKYKGKVQNNMVAVIQKYAEAAKQEDTRVEENPPRKHYLVDTRVEYPIASPQNLPACLSMGRDGRKLGLGGNKNQKRH